MMLRNQSFNLIPTKVPKMPTVQVNMGDKSFMLYSKYDPSRDSKAFAEEAYDENTENYIVYGLGLGYHISELEQLIKMKGTNYHIYIVEANAGILKVAEENINLDGILKNDNITLIIMADEKKSYEKLNKILLMKNTKILIHKPSLSVIPEKFNELKYLLEEYVMKQNSINSAYQLLNINFESNIKNFDEIVDTLFAKYKNKSLYLVAAGPSLDKNIHKLKNIKGKGIILSVGRAVRSLIAAGVIPDYIIITDPGNWLYNMQLKGLDIDIPIIVLSTCDKNVMLNYKGKKYMALQEGFVLAENYAKDNRHSLIETGGSVATTGLDIAIRMGCNPIVFVGQDLAFTNNKTHSNTTFSRDISMSRSLREVEDIYGKSTYTSKNLYIYLRWMQNRIAKEKDIKFIDATEGGAKIQGTKIQKLSEVIDEN